MVITNKVCIYIDPLTRQAFWAMGTAPPKMSTRATTPISLFTCLHDNFLQVHFDNKHRAHTVPDRRRHFYLLFTSYDGIFYQRSTYVPLF